MFEFRFDPAKRTPVVTALVVGPVASRRVRLVFDTCAAMTQIHQATMVVPSM